MMTTANYMRPECDIPPPPATPALTPMQERMAKVRAARKKVGPPPATATPDASAELIIILRELRTMMGYGSPRGHELCAKALKLLETQDGGVTPGVKHET